MKRSVILILAFFCIVSLSLLGFIFFKTQNHASLTSTENTTVSPTISVKDFAPSLPMNQKSTILIRLSDSSEVKYIVPTSQVDTYIKSLPPGEHVVSKSQ